MCGTLNLHDACAVVRIALRMYLSPGGNEAKEEKDDAEEDQGDSGVVWLFGLLYLHDACALVRWHHFFAIISLTRMCISPGSDENDDVDSEETCIWVRDSEIARSCAFSL